MLLSFTTRVRLSLAVAACALCVPAGAQSGEAKPAAQKGTVLFERHEAPVPSSTEAVPQEPVLPPDASAGGVSSSRKRPTRLKRRDDSPDAGSGNTVEEPAAADAGRESPSPVIAVTAADLAQSALVTPEMRNSVQVLATTLDLHLNSHTGAAEVRAVLQLKNTGSAPLTALPLRISGALHWESARIAGGGVAPLRQHHLRDDLDHTGIASEAVITLGTPLKSGEALSVEVFYAGTFAASASRLLSQGAPESRAARSDWDTVTDTFTGLRGEGNVLWYPVTGPPATLKNGPAFTAAVEAERARTSAASFRLMLTLESTGSRPDAAFFCGVRQPLKLLGEAATQPGESTFTTADWTVNHLHGSTPSLFVAAGAPQVVAGGLLRVVTDDASRAGALGEAAVRIRPMLQEWLGPAPSRVLDVIDLPIPDAAGFSEGALLVAPLREGSPAALAPSLVEPLAAAWLPDGIAAAWLRVGVPAFLQAVWAERTVGRQGALLALAAHSAAQRQAAADPPRASSSLGEKPEGEPTEALAECAGTACARGRTPYVFEMMRSELGDTAVMAALSGWRVARERAPQQTAAEDTAVMERLLTQVARPKDLQWFFQGWIDRGNALPELSIVTVAPRKVERSAPVNYLPQARRPVAGPIGAEPVAPPDDPRDHWGAVASGQVAPAEGSWLVAVEVQNAGGTEANVPVTVRAGGLTNTLPLRVPAHGRATIRVPFEAEPEEVVVNDGSVPEVRTATHRRTVTIPR